MPAGAHAAARQSGAASYPQIAWSAERRPTAWHAAVRKPLGFRNQPRTATGIRCRAGEYLGKRKAGLAICGTKPRAYQMRVAEREGLDPKPPQPLEIIESIHTLPCQLGMNRW